jgi:hypothetical protein
MRKMFGKKEEKPEICRLFHEKCKYCASNHASWLMGGNWVDTSIVQVQKTYGKPDSPEYKKFNIMLCFECGRLTEVETT